jgi:2-amino-4-hydroxy-6-hydroxymethyldihydropteridine diphosphokinase
MQGKANGNVQEQVFLSLGSNMGDRKKNIIEAWKELDRILKDINKSSIYETEPLYYTDQPLFLNAVISGFTDLSCFELLKVTQEIEKKLGRDRSKELKMGPRPLDIDLLLYNTLIINSEDLILPHPRLKERRFVLVPLLELEPDLHDLVTGIPYEEILKKLPVQGIYTYKTKDYT